MSLFDHLTVQGYLYDSVDWAIVAPAKSERGERGFRLSDHLWAGGVGEGIVSADGEVSDAWAYKVKLDISAEAINDARATLAPDMADGALGIARIRRFRNEANEPEPGERRVALEGLDEGHLGDRLTGAILTWHAELHGPGPHKPVPMPSVAVPARQRSVKH